MNNDNARSPDVLRDLLVIDRLDVEVTRLESNRVTATYRVTANGETHETEFAYRYAEKVLDPDDPSDRNLAAMMAAQPALNYGLFCREIVLHGPLDKHDRRFLNTYAAHTAREIYVNKFMMNNPFLTGSAADLPVDRRNSYLQATLVFPDSGAEPDSAWETSPDRIAVLSSGGKDSLLTYGLLDEIGCEVHPLFVNESGRHWFTALNAWRHFKDGVPHSSKVWTDADRLFSWMLSHLPFIRTDYSRVRADIYPVRLWTVAVFIFGVLPLVRRLINLPLTGFYRDGYCRTGLEDVGLFYTFAIAALDLDGDRLTDLLGPLALLSAHRVAQALGQLGGRTEGGRAIATEQTRDRGVVHAGLLRQLALGHLLGLELSPQPFVEGAWVLDAHSTPTASS